MLAGFASVEIQASASICFGYLGIARMNQTTSSGRIFAIMLERKHRAERIQVTRRPRAEGRSWNVYTALIRVAELPSRIYMR